MSAAITVCFSCAEQPQGEREDSQAWLVPASNAAVQREKPSERERREDEMKYAEKQHALQAMNDVDLLCQESQRESLWFGRLCLGLHSKSVF